MCIVSGRGDVEVPWWTYGARGMQLWFPSSLEEPLSPTTRDSMTAQSTDPELEFDREVYPIGISIAEVAIIGQFYCPVMQCIVMLVMYKRQVQQHMPVVVPHWHLHC